MRALKAAPQSGVRDAVEEDFEKYRCVLRLDSGGMAEVFLAVSRGVGGFNKLFVLKRLREALAENQDHRAMFLHEARLAARLNHPNVVQTYEVGEDETGIFIAMEYLEGQPLNRLRREILKQEKTVSNGIHARIVSEVLCGLHYAHELTDYDGTELRIVHRDVSPQNVFVTYDGHVKLVDFGIAKTHDSGTQAGIFKGKFSYTAPEQLRGEGVDRRADVFTAGILLWELLTGHKLLGGETPAETVTRLLTEPLPTVRSIVPGVDARLEAIAMRALERNPAHRYQTAQDMRDALEDYLAVSGQVVRQDQIAKLLCELFRTERARVQQAIKDELSAMVSASSASRIVVLTTPRDDAPELELVSPPPAEPPKKKFAYAIAGVAALCVLGYAGTRKPAPPAPTPIQLPAPLPVVESPAPVITASAAPSVAPPVASSVVVKTIVVHPKKVVAPPPPSPTTATAPPPPPPPAAESSAKEKRKFRVDL